MKPLTAIVTTALLAIIPSQVEAKEQHQNPTFYIAGEPFINEHHIRTSLGDLHTIVGLPVTTEAQKNEIMLMSTILYTNDGTISLDVNSDGAMDFALANCEYVGGLRIKNMTILLAPLAPPDLRCRIISPNQILDETTYAYQEFATESAIYHQAYTEAGLETFSGKSYVFERGRFTEKQNPTVTLTLDYPIKISVEVPAQELDVVKGTKTTQYYDIDNDHTVDLAIKNVGKTQSTEHVYGNIGLISDQIPLIVSMKSDKPYFIKAGFHTNLHLH
ncbi:MAG: hypothetical protein WC254_01880 [Candidatus Woesearchaeota archaeon]|jgi:hypothetical protein